MLRIEWNIVIEVIEEAANIFIDYDLDMYVTVITPRGYSAYNPCERRMAPLSHDICGLVLDHEHFGSHIGANGKITDEELEKQNFFHAMTVLASIWSNTVIDNHPVYAEPLAIPNSTDVENKREMSSKVMDLTWRANHMRSSKYMLQLAKCRDTTCCSPLRYPQLQKILPDRFMPYPRVFEHTESGIQALPPKEPIPTNRHFAHLSSLLLFHDIHPPLPDKCALRLPLPFDLYCPSMSLVDLEKRQCRFCGLSFPTMTAMTKHRSSCRKYLSTAAGQLQVPDRSIGDVVQEPDEATTVMHKCSKLCAERPALFEVFGSFIVQDSAQRGISPWVQDI